MDPSFVWSYKTSQTNEAEDDHDQVMQTVAAALICTGAKESCLACIGNCFPSQLYLCHPQLLPNPHVITHWQALYHSRNDHTYITMMRFDVETFELILSDGFTQKFYETPILRDNINTMGTSGPMSSRTIIRKIQDLLSWYLANLNRLKKILSRIK